MEINVLENKKESLVFELKGAGHTLCNAVKEELREDSDINVATYNIEHPLVGSPKFFVKGKNPKKSLEKAIKNLKDKNKEFLKSFKAS